MEDLLAQALDAVGLTATAGAAPLLGRTNRVWRVGDVVVRVIPDEFAPTASVIEAGRELEEAGIAVGPLGPPVQIPGWQITLYPWVESVRMAEWSDVGALVRELHRLPVLPGTPPVTHGSPTGRTWRRVQAALDRGLEAPTRSLLLSGLELLAEIDEVLSVSPPVNLHLDARPANVVVGTRGARLVDLDGLSVGASVFDTSLAYLGCTEKEHEEYWRAYSGGRGTLNPTEREQHELALTGRLVGHAAWLLTRVEELDAHAELEETLARLRHRVPRRFDGLGT